MREIVPRFYRRSLRQRLAAAVRFAPVELNRSTQHPSLGRTDCWCRSNFSIKSQDIRHRSRSFERLRRYPPILAALPAISALCLQLRHEPCPCMSLHMHAIPTWRIRVKGCCVDRLSSTPRKLPRPSVTGAAASLIGRWGQALSGHPRLQCRCRSRARASLRNRHQGPSIMGFEDEVEQSKGRPYRQDDVRSKLPHELT